MTLKRGFALVVGVVMALASAYFAWAVVMIAEDFGRSDVPKGWNTVGLLVFLLLAAGALFEAYRFLSLFAKRP